MSRRSPPASAPPMDDENLLEEILFRLPPPSILPASLVYKRWHGILADRRFVQRFREHHRKPPLLGYFDRKFRGASFTPMAGFTPVLGSIPRLGLLNLVDCRHGVALFLDHARREILLWNPIAGVQRHVAFPPGLNHGTDCEVQTAAVLCCASDGLPVHRDCHLSAFTLVLVGDYPKRAKKFTCLYESKSGVWGQVISTAARSWVYRNRPSVLVGSTLCWLLLSSDILQLDFKNRTLVVIEKPAYAYDADANCSYFQPLRTEDGGLGLAVRSKNLSIQLWVRKSNYEDTVSWVLKKTVQLGDQISHPLFPRLSTSIMMMGYDEDTNVIFLCYESCHHFMLQLDSMQFRHISTKPNLAYRVCYPYRDFYTEEAPQ
ncbi:hypothetical protein VPH35_107773 [Triticum aestivum]|uniref:uncharacterized protein n=1 Tax=Triticum aestivum TaxID=4565 RepID=UPI001D00446F|nr:uncharacterized protein LOC123133098 [Triticum aestivum]